MLDTHIELDFLRHEPRSNQVNFNNEVWRKFRHQTILLISLTDFSTITLKPIAVISRFTIQHLPNLYTNSLFGIHYHLMANIRIEL